VQVRGGEAEDSPQELIMAYRWEERYWPSYVDWEQQTELAGWPEELRLQVWSDNPELGLQVLLEDSTGQRFCYTLEEYWGPGWTRSSVPLGHPTRSWGGAGDGEVHYPLALRALRLVEGPRGSARSGEVRLREAVLHTRAPAAGPTE
jgi:hypothetical protein